MIPIQKHCAVPTLISGSEPNRNGTAPIISVRDDSAAADVGVRAGDSVLAVDGRSVQSIEAALMPRCLVRPDPAAAAYALNTAVSARRATPRRLTLHRAGGGEQDVLVPVKTSVTLPAIDSRMLPEGFGYIVIRSFTDQAVIDQFDAALLSSATHSALPSTCGTTAAVTLRSRGRSWVSSLPK